MNREILVFLSVDLVNDKDDRLLGLTQNAREFLIERRQALFCIDKKKQNVAIVNGVLDCMANLDGQFGFACTGNAAGIPRDKWLSSARADGRDTIARYPGLIMHDGDLPTNQELKSC